ncbi:MAG: PLP-dependent transferase, partial [Pseudomonadota bacterium]
MTNINLDTLFAQLDGAIDMPTGGVVPAIQPATTFVRGTDNVPTSPDHLYSRDDDDLTRLGERLLAKAEGGGDALLFPSGMAAIAALLRTVPNGGRIIMQSGIYWGTTKWTRDFCARRAVTLDEVDLADASVRDAMSGSADVVWAETPSNPYLKTVDINACAKLANSLGAVLCIDSTAATPVLTQPLAHGADYVMHSATKGINGHSDVLAGVLVTADAKSERWSQIKNDRHDAGAVLSPFAAWLLIRGMRTMPLRVDRMCANAMAVAQAMADHEAVSHVLYPGLETDTWHDLAKRQMKGGFGSLLSIRIASGREGALAAIGKMKLFKRATSL